MVFEIVEGPEIYVERINISGNTRSEEKILRREIPMAEGDLFTSQKLARAKQRLTNLNYFDKVKAKTAPGSAKDKIVVNIDVTEKPTGLFSIGGGYSSQDGVLGTVDLSQRNFLGKGWEVFLRLRGGENLQTGTIGFTEPWLFDRPLSAGFDLFNTRRHLHRLHGRSRSAATSGSATPSGSTPAGMPSTGPARTRSATCNELGSQQPARSGGHPLHVPDRGDLHPRHPRQHLRPDPGGTASISLDFAGVGFGEQFVRSSLQPRPTSSRTPWMEHVLELPRSWPATSVGWGKDPVPLFERFYLGGSNSLRSSSRMQVSPSDDSGTRIGGNIPDPGHHRVHRSRFSSGSQGRDLLRYR